MSSFFTLPGPAKKRKRVDSRAASGSKKARQSGDKAGSTRKRPSERDEEISSDSEGSENASGATDISAAEEDEEEFQGETTAEKRLRLAQQYLDNLREEVDDEGGFDAAEIDRDLIAERLKEDVAEEKGRLYRHIATQYSFSAATSTLFYTDSLSTTSIAVCEPYVYTVTKDRYLNKWKLPEYPPLEKTSNFTPSKKPKRIRYAQGEKSSNVDFNGHIGEILCVVASGDGKFVATGGTDKRIVVWDAETLRVLKVFKHHRGAVTCLVFRRGTNQLYSGAADRAVNVWSLDELAYVETLHGHEDEVVGISALAAERCVSVGARDRTAMLWKIVDETRLVFRGAGAGGNRPTRKKKDGMERYEEGRIDCVAMIDDEHFVTGSDNGDICLWSVHKKKPIHTLHVTHGLAPGPTPEQSSAEENPPQEPPCPPQPRYITALTAIPYSDLIFSGSWDGVIRAWRVTEDKRRLEAVGAFGAVRGIVNGIAVLERGKKSERIVVAVGTGKELRGGRWMNVPGRNGGYVLEVEKKGKEDALEKEAEKDEE